MASTVTTLVVEGLTPVRTRKDFEELAGVAQAQPVSVGVTNAGLFTDWERANAFAEAVRVAMQVAHENVAATLGVNPAGPMRWAVAWERFEGHRLDELLRQRGVLLPDEAVAIISAAGEALGAAHAKNVLHGDFNASWVTLMPSPDGSRVKVAGFGLGMLPAFVGGPRPTVAGDIAALAALLHELLTLHRPAGNVSTLPPAAMHLAPVVARALGYDPKQRYRTIAEFEQALGNANRTRVSSGNVIKPTDFSKRSGIGLRTLGPWQLEKLLGEGAMGQVFLAKHALLGRQAAIKVLRPEQYQRDDLIQRFFQEARAVNQINHEHIVEISDFGQETGPDGRPEAVYFVMELLQGRTLTDRLAQGPLTVERAVHVIKQLASALAAAHALGVVHRDVKTDNVFLITRHGDAEYVKVLDFGVAKLTQPTAAAPTVSTMDGAIIGTPTSMSPEQASGGVVDARADVYAVGVLLYLLLSGKLPIDGENFGKLVALLLTKKPDPLPEKNQLGEPIPPALAALVLRCLEKDPAARPQSMQALLQELEAPRAPVAPPAKSSRLGLLVGAVASLALAASGVALWASREVVTPLVVVDAGAAPVEPPDAAVEVVDAGVEPEDAGAPEVDAGVELDAGTPMDAGVKPHVPPPQKPVPFTPQLVQQVVSRGRAPVQNCLSRYRASLPGSAGAVKVQWTVQTSGEVTEVQVVEGVEPGSELGKCLVKAVRSFDFPKHTGPGARTMKLPFTYAEK